MRFRITMKMDKAAYGSQLPINYPYLLSSWIYGVLGNSDAAYATWLHDNAFRDGSKAFKYFVFSKLDIPQRRAHGDRLHILSDTLSFYLSFLPERSTEEFIKGIFQSQDLTLGDRKSRVRFEIAQVELTPEPNWENHLYEFRTLSPVVVSVKEPDGRISYVSPEREDYGELLLKNLTEKYKVYYKRAFDGSSPFSFELLSPPRSRLVTIKAGEPEETRIRGFDFSFRFKADEELLRLAYESGLGEKGSLGFGMLGVEDESPR